MDDAMQAIVIADDDRLYRRIHPTFFRKDGSVSSHAFKLGKFPDDQISVDLARLTMPSKARMLGNSPPYPLGCFPFCIACSLGFTFRYNPLPDAEEPNVTNPAHCLLLGENDDTKCDELADEVNKSVHFRPPPRGKR